MHRIVSYNCPFLPICKANCGLRPPKKNPKRLRNCLNFWYLVWQDIFHWCLRRITDFAIGRFHPFRFQDFQAFPLHRKLSIKVSHFKHSAPGRSKSSPSHQAKRLSPGPDQRRQHLLPVRIAPHAPDSFSQFGNDAPPSGTKRLDRLRTNPFNPFQLTVDKSLAPFLAVERNGKAVHLLLDTRQKVEHRRGGPVPPPAAGDNRNRVPPCGGGHPWPARQSECRAQGLQHLVDHPHLPLAAVGYDQIGQLEPSACSRLYRR